LKYYIEMVEGSMSIATIKDAITNVTFELSAGIKCDGE